MEPIDPVAASHEGRLSNPDRGTAETHKINVPSGGERALKLVWEWDDGGRRAG